MGHLDERASLLPLAELVRVFRDVPIGFCTFDLDFRFVFVNEWLAALNGVPADAHLGRTIHEVIPDVAAEVEAQLRQVVETGEPVIGGEVEAEARAFPGEQRIFLHTCAAIHDADDEIIGLNCLVQDITEQRRAVTAARDRERRHDLLMNSVPALISYLDQEKRFLFTNKAYGILYGATVCRRRCKNAPREAAG